MNSDFDILWLSVSPHLKGFDQRLLVQLSKAVSIRRWEYCQTVDEPCCIDYAVEALHDYVSDRIALEQSVGKADHKVHLLGHGVSGVVGLLYARQYPDNVASLTLLSVGAMPAMNWQAHYYVQRQQQPCCRERLLAQMTRLLFGERPDRFAKALAVLLARDLDSNLTLHSLASHTHIDPGGVKVPLLVCNGETDDIVYSQKMAPQLTQLTQWDDWLKVGDRLWNCPNGNHFFHFHYPERVAQAIKRFWQQLKPQSVEMMLSDRNSPERQTLVE